MLHSLSACCIIGPATFLIKLCILQEGLTAYVLSLQAVLDPLSQLQPAPQQDSRPTEQVRELAVADLDEEAAKRRQRVALWQEQRRAAEQAEDAERKKQEEAAPAEAWTLEDDIENELGQVTQLHLALAAEYHGSFTSVASKTATLDGHVSFYSNA